jgi:NAD(P)-dependent dehydrogenase (short-subunit alcohol dehydrogenase family)
MKINNLFSLKGKTVIITGAAGLLGKNYAQALSEAGANLALLDKDKKSLEELNQSLQGGQKSICINCDISSEKNIVEATNKIVSEFKGPFVLINNAAIDSKVSLDGKEENFNRLENFPLDTWTDELNIGLTAAMLFCKHLGPIMAEQGGGLILNISSDLGIISPDQRLYRLENIEESKQNVKPVSYSVIKHALIGLTKYVATYWAKDGVRCNAIAPGGVFSNQPNEFVTKLESLIPLGRMAEEDEYSGLIVFLCSDASSYINGETIVIDGGRSIW